MRSHREVLSYMVHSPAFGGGAAAGGGGSAGFWPGATPWPGAGAWPEGVLDAAPAASDPPAASDDPAAGAAEGRFNGGLPVRARNYAIQPPTGFSYPVRSFSRS